jgi:hypothetical protein
MKMITFIIRDEIEDRVFTSSKTIPMNALVLELSQKYTLQILKDLEEELDYFMGKEAEEFDRAEAWKASVAWDSSKPD